MVNDISEYGLHEMELLIGREISHLRKKKGMTGVQLGLLLGVSQQQISRYERAETKVTICTLFTILNFLDVSLISFFERILVNVQCKEKLEIERNICNLFYTEQREII